MKELDRDLLSIQETRDMVREAKEAQLKFRNFDQGQVDRVVAAMSSAGEQAAVSLAKAAKAETGYGKWEDKVIKNNYASTAVYKAIKDMKTVGVLRECRESGIVEIGVPVGVIAGLIPSTNPTSTVIYKSMISLKSGNAIVFSPHPSALNCIKQATAIMHDAAVEAGAPKGIISCVSTPTLDGTSELMSHKDVNLILATGGDAMVRAAYRSGTPAIGVGPGNSPAFIERSADIPMAVKRIIQSKTFDNGVICSSEQSIVVEAVIEDEVTAELKRQGAYFLNEAESSRLGGFLLRPNMTINPAVVGKSAIEAAELVGLKVPSDTRILISRQSGVSHDNPYSREKLAPILAFYVEPDWERACLRCLELLANEGKGHSMCIHSRNEAVIREFGLKKNVSRVLVNTYGSLGGVGATTDLMPSFTLGCGAAGGGATSDNVGPMHLLNIRRMAYGMREFEDLQPQTAACSSGSAENDALELAVKAIMKQLF